MLLIKFVLLFSVYWSSPTILPRFFCKHCGTTNIADPAVLFLYIGEVRVWYMYDWYKMALHVIIYTHNSSNSLLTLHILCLLWSFIREYSFVDVIVSLVSDLTLNIVRNILFVFSTFWHLFVTSQLHVLCTLNFSHYHECYLRNFHSK
jgi:hypothetical protein